MLVKKLNKLVGLKKSEFDEFVKDGQIHLSQARLIPTYKVGDELTLTSIFLSTLRLVKEFRNTIFSEAKLPKGGKVYYYTEASFKDIDSNSRIDGLLIIVIGGVIKDAAFFEMKNKNNQLEEAQIKKYVELAKKLRVSKIITVSNQFVAHSSHSPIDIRVPKSISLHHFSWVYINTIGQLLLFKNESNIEDEDQVELMKEVLSYFEHKVSGVTGYNQMKKGWVDVVESINSHKKLLMSDKSVEEAVVSWHEEERDMSLILSRELGMLVKNNYPKSKLKGRLKEDIKELVSKQILKSSLVVKRAVSNIDIVSNFNTRTISMSVNLIPPMDKGTKARIGWVIRQTENCRKKHDELFHNSSKELWIEANIKYSPNDVILRYNDINDLYDLVINKEIIGFKIIYIRDLGKKFSSSRKFVEVIEKMLIDYYKCYVQNLKNWTRPVPKIVEE